MEGTERLATKLRRIDNAKGAKPKIVARAESDLLPLILAQLEDDKAEQTISIDVRGRASFTDHLVVTTGRSNRHVASIADHLIEAIAKRGTKPRSEGMPNADWVLIDAGDVIIHIFRPEVREFYNLEKMWSARTAAKA